MTCRKCENRINTGTKCYQCGYDNAGPLENFSTKSKNKNRRSPVLIAFMSLFIILAVISILSSIGVLLNMPGLAMITVFFTLIFRISNSIFHVSIPFIPYQINAIISIAVAVFEIYLCISMLRLRKRALKAYVILIVVLGILQILNMPFMLAGLTESVSILPIMFSLLLPFILKGLLLFIVNMTDGKYFGGTSYNEPISVIRARQRREREES